MTTKVEEIDQIPVIARMLKNMQVDILIDKMWPVHGNHRGLTHGQLAFLFIIYVIHMLNHRFSYMEEWLIKHKTVLEQVTGWHIKDKDATDDRLCALVGELGRDDAKFMEFQRIHGQHIVSAYELPTECARYDTTSVNVHHSTENNGKNILSFGHSKDNRPDLLQFKQGLGTLDPAGVPLLTETMAGNCADDTRYVPVWREMSRTIGHTGFLYVADCKAAPLENRALIDQENGFYLFPMPVTGTVPAELKTYVPTLQDKAEEIRLTSNNEEERGEQKSDKDEKNNIIGKGFSVKEEISYKNGDQSHTWKERRLVIRSDAYADSQIKSLENRLKKAAEALGRIRVKKDETVEQFRLRADRIISRYSVAGCIGIEVKETETVEKKYLKRGRPAADTPCETVKHKKIELDFKYVSEVIEEKKMMAGWRIYVTNMPEEKLSLQESVRYYRDEWTVERGMHRFKRGSLPVLPLFLRIPERIKGLMLLLTIALQVLTLMEFVIRRELAACNETLSGLVPGNPKMKTARPTAERILTQFKGIYCLIEEKDGYITGSVVQKMTPLQERILTLLKIPHNIYNINFSYQLLQEVT